MKTNSKEPKPEINDSWEHWKGNFKTIVKGESNNEMNETFWTTASSDGNELILAKSENRVQIFKLDEV